MNRKQRRIAQSQHSVRPTVQWRGASYTLEEASLLAIRECNLGNPQEAVDIFQLIIAKAPDYAQAYNNRGSILQEMKRYDEALASYGKAITLNPRFAEAYNNRSVLLQKKKRYGEALADCDKAIALKPDYAGAHNNRGSALMELLRYEEALASHDKAIALQPDDFQSFNNHGNILQKMERYEEALPSYDKAVALNPAYAEGYYNRGVTLYDMKRYSDAVASYERALALKPDYPYLFGSWLQSKMYLCDWRGMEGAIQKLKTDIDAGLPVSIPFVPLATPLSAADHLACATIYAQDKFPAAKALWKGERYAHERIRIGYFSSDLRNHALSYLLAEFFERHDRSKFEVTAFSFGPKNNDAMRARLQNAFEHFIDVHDNSDEEIAALARQREIDIAVDLNGYTVHSRTGIFTHRPAPVQVSYMGYPSTMAASYIDYLMADATVIPEEHAQYYTENIVRLPDSYWTIDSTTAPSHAGFTRADMGLPQEGFVFCCFNNSYKISPDVFDIWMRLLHKIEGSVLWLLEGNPASADNLRREAMARGVSADRLVFAKRIDSWDHLARQRLADLFVDTFYYNAHTTTSDALWGSLPVLTCMGKTFASRVAASLLKAARLPEMITHSHAEYEARALELAADPQKLSAIRQKLAQNKTTCPLFDTHRFTRHFEDAYVKMHEKSQSGLAPQDIYVEART